MKLDEVTGDDNFDKMIGKIVGGEEPTMDPSRIPSRPDRKTRELTHRIFLALRDFDDPRTTEKFLDFMRKTLDPNVGPID